MQNSTSPVTTPTLKRRLICLVYDAFLLTAVVMFGLFIFLFAAKMLGFAVADSSQKLGGPVVEIGRLLVMFLVPGAYLIHSWTGSGHTLAMKTWRIKLVQLGHAKVPFRTAAIRYLLSWGWVLPALAVCWAFGLTGKPAHVAAALAVGIIAWGLTAFLDKDRQFLHDKLAGTRLIALPKPVKAGKAAAQ